MRPRRLSEVAAAVDGSVVGDDVLVSAVVMHSEQAGSGSLFVALPGQRADGASFVGDAFEHGAAAALVSEGVDVPGPSVVVRATGDALLRLAADER